jgi:hypothetical protein
MIRCGAHYFPGPDFQLRHPIHEWRNAGLNVPSTIRVHKLTVLAKDEISRRLGDLAEADRSALKDVLRGAFSFDR